MRLLFSFCLLVVVATGAAGTFVYNEYILKPISTERQPVVYEVQRGASTQRVLQDLESQGIIKDAFVLRMYLRFFAEDTQVKVGEYEIGPHMGPLQIVGVLSSGKSMGRSFTIPEGLNVFEIAEMYEAEGFGTRQEFLDLVFDEQFVSSLLGYAAPSLEGYLFPETYMITKYTSTRELIQVMVSTFNRAYDREIGENPPPGWSKHQVVTMASIIEKETGAPEERRVISGVFHNRLQKRMRLQTDPTILYGIALDNKKVILRITRADLRRPHPYNTYVINGLPPGPIANPGAEALASVINPEDTRYLFFVSKNDGTHVFSETYEQHKAAVQRFQLDPAARQGKSWRDLKRNRQ